MRSQILQICLFALLAAFASAFTTTVPLPVRHTKNAAVVAGTRSSSTSSLAGATTLEPPTTAPKTTEKEKVDDSTKDAPNHKKGGWAVRLFNDPMNKREFVAMCLSKITGLTDGQAYQVMMQAHQNGVSVVGRYDQERAELYRDSLRDNGLVVDMIPVEED